MSILKSFESTILCSGKMSEVIYILQCKIIEVLGVYYAASCDMNTYTIHLKPIRDIALYYKPFAPTIKITCAFAIEGTTVHILLQMKQSTKVFFCIIIGTALFVTFGFLIIMLHNQCLSVAVCFPLLMLIVFYLYVTIAQLIYFDAALRAISNTLSSVGSVSSLQKLSRS